VRCARRESGAEAEVETDACVCAIARRAIAWPRTAAGGRWREGGGDCAHESESESESERQTRAEQHSREAECWRVCVPQPAEREDEDENERELDESRRGVYGWRRPARTLAGVE
jgi:hypothetical protein